MVGTWLSHLKAHKPQATQGSDAGHPPGHRQRRREQAQPQSQRKAQVACVQQIGPRQGGLDAQMPDPRDGSNPGQHHDPEHVTVQEPDGEDGIEHHLVHQRPGDRQGRRRHVGQQGQGAQQAGLAAAFAHAGQQQIQRVHAYPDGQVRHQDADQACLQVVAQTAPGCCQLEAGQGDDVARQHEEEVDAHKAVGEHGRCVQRADEMRDGQFAMVKQHPQSREASHHFQPEQLVFLVAHVSFSRRSGWQGLWGTSDCPQRA